MTPKSESKPGGMGVFKYELLLLLISMIWGSAFVAQQIGMEQGLGPMTFGGLRFALGCLSLIPLIIWRKRNLPAADREAKLPYKACLGAGLLLFAASALQQIGLQYTSSANSTRSCYFKVTFDQAGNVTSILDKQHGNKEIVDPDAPQPLNQYVLYKKGALAGQVTTATLVASTGPVLGCMTADGVATGLDGLRRKVVLYDALPRIDIINDAVKGQQIANVEMGYFAFPLKVDNFMLRHEMPTGDMKPGVTSDINDPNTEQYFTSSTAFSTVNRWIDASNQRDWGVI